MTEDERNKRIEELQAEKRELYRKQAENLKNGKTKEEYARILTKEITNMSEELGTRILESDPGALHFTYGMYLRNEYNLWHSEYFPGMADDISDAWIRTIKEILLDLKKNDTLPWEIEKTIEENNDENLG